MRATSGKSLFTEILYVAQIIRYVIVCRIASEPAPEPAQRSWNPGTARGAAATSGKFFDSGKIST